MRSPKSTLSRRWMLAGLLSSFAAPALAKAPSTSPRPMPRPASVNAVSAATMPRSPAPVALPSAPSELIAQARLGGDISYVVMDARTGQVLEAQDAGKGLPPASVAKAATALFALNRLGPNHRLMTRLLATGPIRAGTLEGDLILKGGGDPTLDTDRLGQLATALRQKGITRVTGRFIVDGTALPALDLIDPQQPEHVGYNPSISGLNLNYNRVHFEWKRDKAGWKAGVDARGKSHLPTVSLVEARIVERSAPLFTYTRDGNKERWTVASASLGKGGSRWLPTRQPERYAGEVFQTLCAAQGLRLPNPQIGSGQGTIIAELASPPLTTLLREMLRHSTNLTAETMGLLASGARDLRSSAQIMNQWLAQTYGVETSFVDHSGLGAASRISAEAMARIMLKSQDLSQLLRPFPISEKGKPPAPEVFAKTGTLNFVSGLSGIVAAQRPLVFAIFTADVRRRDGLPKAQRERPQGGPEWTRRARNLQAQLLQRWAAVYI